MAKAPQLSSARGADHFAVEVSVETGNDSSKFAPFVGSRFLNGFVHLDVHPPVDVSLQDGVSFIVQAAARQGKSYSTAGAKVTTM